MGFLLMVLCVYGPRKSKKDSNKWYQDAVLETMKKLQLTHLHTLYLFQLEKLFNE